MKRNRLTGWWIALLLVAPRVVLAEDTPLLGLIQDIQKQMTQMQVTIERQNTKIEQLEKNQSQIRIHPSSSDQPAAVLPSSAGAPPPSEVPAWLKDLSLKGDLRLRYEVFDFHSGSPTGSADRTRFRYRLRYGFEKKFTEEIKIGFSFISGENTNGVNVDPTSTNTTFDNLFNFKDIYIDRAYAMVTPAWAKAGPLEKTTLAGGKFDNPFEKGSSEMVWDRDIKPEGAYEKFDFKFLDSEDLDLKGFVTLGQFILDEDTATGEADAELYGEQIGIQASGATSFFKRPVELTSAFSFFDYRDYAVNGNFLIGTTSLARGNTNAAGPATVLDSEDFQVFEYYNEISFYPYDIPVSPFLDVAHNVASQLEGDEELAWSLGIKIGNVKKKGDWEIVYSYRRVEPEAVVGAFADSDFGLGHAGKRGNALKLGYGLTDFLTLNGAVSLVNNLTVDTAGVRDEEQRRFQVDMNWKF